MTSDVLSCRHHTARPSARRTRQLPRPTRGAVPAPPTPRERPMTKIQETGDKVLANVERVIVGKHHEVRLALVALLCRGHLLIEDVPGTGKTVLAKAIARSLGCSLPAHPVHAGPAALRRDRPVDLQPEDPGVRVPAGPDHEPGRPRRRDQPGDAQDPVARCSSAWRSARRRSTARPTRCPIRSSSSPPRTRSSTRARSPCPRPSSTGSCSGSASATRSRSRRSSSSTSRSGRTRSRSSRRSSTVEELREMQAAVREIYVDSTVVRLHRPARRTARATIPTSTSAPRRAARSRCTAPARRWPGCSAATTSSRTTSRPSPSRPSPTA